YGWHGLTDDAARGRTEKLQQYAEFGTVRSLQLQLALGLFQRESIAIQRLVCALDLHDGLRRKTAPLEAFSIDAVRLGIIAGGSHIRRDILEHHRTHGGNDVRADLAELVDQRESAEDGIVIDVVVARQRRFVGENGVIADLAIVRYVHVVHSPVVVADARRALVLHRAAVEGAEFAYGVAVADLQRGRLIRVLLVLRRFAQGRKLEDTVIATDGGRPLDDDVAAYRGAAIDADAGLDHRKGANFDAGVELGLGIDDRGRMDSGLHC